MANTEPQKVHQKPDSEPSASPQPTEQGLSLDRLSEAFAEMLNSGTDPYGASTPAALSEEYQADLPIPIDGEEDAACPISPRSILEAMLFLGNPENQPLASREVASLMRGVRPAEIDQLVHELNEKYTQDRCPYEIVSEGAGYRMVLREEFSRLRDRFYGRRREKKLSQAALEVLSIVAYLQPVTTDELNKRRGTSSGSILSQLVGRRLLRIDRPKNRPEDRPRKVDYYTTERFLQLFGLGSLEELPRNQELEEE